MASIPKVYRGLAAVMEALQTIGHNKTDSDLAKIIVDKEADIRYLVYFVQNIVNELTDDGHIPYVDSSHG